MHMKLFSIGPLNVYSYGLMIALGIIAAARIADWIRTRCSIWAFWGLWLA